MTPANDSAAESEKASATASPDTVAAEPSPKAKPRMSPERLAAEIARLDRLLIFALLVFAFLLGSFAARNSDFWMHLAAGRALAQGRYTFGTDPFAYTTAGVYWANHSWLYDGLLYGFTSALGGIDRPATGAVLVVVKALLIALLTWVLLAVRRRNQSAWLPVVCVGLGMLVLSPRLYLQPTMVSFLFLGLTLSILARDGKRRRTPETRPLGVLLTDTPQRLYALPPLFLLWVNLDSWFLLGPVLAALCLIGDFLQEKLSPLRTADDAPQPGELRTQLLVLVLGLAACLVSPHHYRAFALPPDMFAVLQPGGLRSDPMFHNLFVSPLSKDYFTAMGNHIAGLAYFGLVAIGIVSFAVNSTGTRGWRTLTWLVFCLLSAANQRFIPFFAIIAGPITALNLQDYIADRHGTALPDRDFGRGWALAGRGLTFLVLMLLIAGAWSGLLYANADNPRLARRVAWSVEVDPSLRQTAEQLAVWRQAGRLAETSHGFASDADLANYFAWFCPAEKGFLDYRYPLFAATTGDYVALRRWLEGRAEATPGGQRGPDWQRIFRQKRIDHVVLSGSQFNGTVSQLLQHPREWPLLYLDGRTTIFGWNDPALGAKADRFAGMKFDLSARAFGPDPDRAPAEGMPRPPHVAGDWERYWQAPLPSSLDADEAFMDLLYFEAAKQQGQDARLTATVYTGIASCVGAGTPGNVLALVERLEFARFPWEKPKPGGRRSHGGLLATAYLRGPDQGPPAAPLVALRAARRAQAANPNDAEAHRSLARAAYYLWTTQENYWAGAAPPGPISPAPVRQIRQLLAQRAVAPGPYLSRWITRSIHRRQLLRQVQVVAALQNVLLLKPDDQQAHNLLASVYWHMGYFDLAVEHLRAVLNQVKAAAPPEEADRKKQHDLRLSRQERSLQELEKEVDELRNDYELHAAKLSPPQRRILAFAPFGLAKLALTALEQADMAQLSPQEGELFVYLLVTTGQINKLVDEKTGKPGVLPDAANLKKALGRDFHGYQAVLSAAVGDYAQAARSLEEAQPPPFQPSHPPLADMLQALTFGLLQPHPLCRLIGAPFLQQQLMQAEVAMARQRGASDFRVLRGLTALDAGDVDAAKDHFRAAVQSAGLTPPFESRPIAARYLELLRKAKR